MNKLMLLSLGSLARSEPPHWPSPPTSLSPSSSPLPPSLAPPPPSRSLSPTPPPSPSPPEPSPPPPPSPLLPTLSYPPVQPVSGQGISEQEAIKLFGTQGVHIINTMKNWVGLFFKYQDGAYRFPGDDLFHGSLSLNNLDGFPENAILNVAASCGYGIKSCSVRVELSLPSPFNLLYQEQGDYFSEFYTRQAFPPPPSPLPPPEPSPPPPPEPSPPPPFSPMPSSPFSPGGNQDMTLGIFCLLLFQHFCISCEQKFTDRSVQALNVKRISRDIHGAVQLCAAHLLINYLNLNLALDALLKTEFNTYLFYKTLSNESSLNYLSFISSKIRLFGSFVALTTVSLTSINDVSIMQAHLDRDYALKKYYTQIVLFCFTLSILYLLHSSRTNNYLRRVSNNLRRVSNNFYAFIDPSVVRGRSVVVANVLIPNEGERRSLQPNTEIIRGVVIGVRIHAQPNSQERLRTNLASEVVGDQGIELVEIGGQSEPAQLNPLGITSPDLANQMGSPEGIEFAQISDQLQTHFENQEASVRAVQVRAEQANQEVPVVINLETSQMQEGIVRGSVFIEETLRRSHSERVAATHQEPSVWDSARHWLESQMAYIFPEDELVAADQA